LGSALAMYYQELNSPRILCELDLMKGGYLGVKETPQEIESFLKSVGAKYQKIEREDILLDRVSSLLVDGKVVGWHFGKMEFGPRALGHRSILGDPRDPNMQSRMQFKN